MAEETAYNDNNATLCTARQIYPIDSPELIMVKLLNQINRWPKPVINILSSQRNCVPVSNVFR